MLSLICTTYNRVEFISEMIDSVLAQTFQDWELIIIDDGSEIEYVEYLDQVVSIFNDNRIKLNLSSHLGRAKQLSLAHSLVKGDYIAWIDDDDKLVNHNCLHLCVNELAVDPSISMVFTDYLILNNRTGCVTYSRNHNRGYIQLYHNLLRFDTLGFRVFRKSLWDRLEGFDTSLDYAIDWDLSLRLEEVGRVIKVPINGYLYREHDNRISVNHKDEQTRDSIKAVRNALVRRNDREQLVIDDDGRWRFS